MSKPIGGARKSIKNQEGQDVYKRQEDGYSDAGSS